MVVSSPGQDPLPSDLARYATQWGIDPVHAGKATPDNPTIANFPLRVSDDSVHELPELPGVSVAVAGHAVAFDEARDLWYCDIDIDTGATYFPFVRLALTRWQPNSLGGLLFSPVVLADFVQLAADRIATVTPPSVVIPGTVPSWAVSISGPSYPTTTHDPSRFARTSHRAAETSTGDGGPVGVGRSR